MTTSFFKIRLYRLILLFLLSTLIVWSSLANKITHRKVLSRVFYWCFKPSFKMKKYFKQLTFAIQTNCFSLITGFGTFGNSILADSIAFFNGWVIRTKFAKTTLTSTIKTSGTIGKIGSTSCTLTFGAFSVINNEFKGFTNEKIWN